MVRSQEKMNSSSGSSRSRTLLVICFILCFSGAMFIWIGAVAEEEPLEDVETRDSNGDIKSDGATIGVRGTDAPIGNPPTKAPTDESPATAAPVMASLTPAPDDSSVRNAPVGSNEIDAPVDGNEPEAPVVEPSTFAPAGSPPTSAPVVDASPTDGSGGGECTAVCNGRRGSRTELYGGDILDRAALLEVAKQEKSKLISKLHVDYGKETFENIYVDKEASTESEERYKWNGPVIEEGKSVETLKRKFLIKVLTVQAALAKKDAEATGCDCSNGDTPLSGRTLNEGALSEDLEDRHYVRYVWATGGHSAAAGHGNLYNESYTAYMERDLKPLFGALGIEFEGRNYAMGGTSSGYEVSMCYEQIFGDDVDFMSWDFGMTDAKEDIRLLHYGYRGGLNPGRPPIMGLHVTGGRAKGKRAQLANLESLGMAAFLGRTSDEMSEYIPLSSGLSDSEIEAMPEYVRNFNCGAKLETGDPYCSINKYTKVPCPDRSKQVGWHPGYKVHALDGHSLSLFMVQILLDALKDLAEHDEKDPETLLATLKKEDEDLHQSFVNADLPEYINEFYKRKEGGYNLRIDYSLLFKGPSFCRTGRLPAKSRFLGYLANDGKIGDVAPFTKETYEVGIPEGEAAKTVSESNEEMRLVYTTSTKERNPECTDYILKPDNKDYWITYAGDGLTKFVFPNEAEKRAYRYDSSNFQGLIFIAFRACDWGKCGKKDMRPNMVGDANDEDEDSGKVEMFVNDVKVKFLVDVGGSVSLVVGKSGPYWKANSNGEYELKVRVKEPDSFIGFTSVILY